MKLVTIPTTYEELRKYAQLALEENDVVKALKYYASALKIPNLTPLQLHTLKRDYARTLSMRCKYGYSNKVLYDIISEYKKDKEAMSLLMFNFKALNLEDQANYYQIQCQNYLDKRAKEFQEMLKENAGEMLLIDGEEFPIDEITEEQIKTFVTGETLQEDKPKRKSIFTVIDNNSKFQELFQQVYQAASTQQYAEAIDIANKALALNVKEEDKLPVYYTKAATLMLMGYTRESLDLANSILEKFPNDYATRILKCEIMSNLKDREGLILELKFFNTRPLDEILPFDRILSVFLRNALYDEGLEFIKPRMTYFSDSYTMMMYLGMLYFNKGEIEKAKGVLSELNGLYGDLCEARHLLNYINYGLTKPLTVSPQLGDIFDLTTQYVNEFCLYLEQDGEAAASYATMDISNFIAKLRWIAQNRAEELSLAVVEKTYIIRNRDLNKNTQEKLKELKKQIVKLLATDDDLPYMLRELITYYQLISKSKVDITVDGKFYTANCVLDVFNMPTMFMRAAARAISFCIVRGEEIYGKAYNFIHDFNAIYQDRKFAWKSETAIFATYLYYIFDKTKLDVVIPGFKYNKKLFQKYIEEFAGDTIED